MIDMECHLNIRSKTFHPGTFNNLTDSIRREIPEDYVSYSNKGQTNVQV